MKNFKLNIENNIATLIFDMPNSRTNVFTAEVLTELEKCFDDLEKNGELKALFIESAKEKIFIAGADINSIKKAKSEEEIRAFVKQGQLLFNKLSSLPFTTIALIDGACLGGGLEFALACDYRIATNHQHTRIGLPEVNLGIIPGFGGTQRLPKLVGFSKALELMVAGKQLKGDKALKLGVVDASVPRGYLAFKKEEYISDILAGTLRAKIVPKRRGILWYEKVLPLRLLIAYVAKRAVLKKTKGHYPAPLALIEVMKKSFGKSLNDGLRIERNIITKLALSDISKNLIELFLISERLKHENFSSAKGKELQHASVVGTGAMGSGIAWALNHQGMDVRLKDQSLASAGRAVATIRKIYEGIKKRGRLSEREVALKMDKITFTTDYIGFSKTELLVEAVYEDLALKQEVYADFEKVLSPKAIMATNTSSISVTLLARRLLYPERFVGMHFFNPVNKMPLVEIIAGEKTSEETIATVVKLSKRLGKTPIKVKESEGFLVNRLLLPYLMESVRMFEEGESIKKIDQTLVAFGMPMGAFTLIDTVGVDVGEKVTKILYEAYGERMFTSQILTKMLEKEWLGRKAKKGFYDYHAKKPKLNAEINTLQYGKVELHKETIVERAILTMINEASRCLEEGVVDNAQYLDMAMVMGTGFPAFRGGLMRYADSLGVEQVVSRLEALSQKYGNRFAPSTLLVEMRGRGGRFYEEG